MDVPESADPKTILVSFDVHFFPIEKYLSYFIS